MSQLGQPLRDILGQRELAAPMCNGKHGNWQDPTSEGLAEGVRRTVAQGLPQIVLANHWSIAMQQILLQHASQGVHVRVTLSHATSVVIALTFAQMESWSESSLYFRAKMSAKSLKRIKPYHEARLKNMLCFAQSDSPRSLKKALNVLRTGVWFEGLRMRLHQSTAYGVGQRLQPHTYRDGIYHHNAWAKYAVGKHLPSAETVYACEQQVPRSSHLLEDPSWDLLDVSRPIGGDGDKLLRRLRPSIQSALFEERALAMGRYVRRTAPVQPLIRLEGQADLQAIAAAVVLLREAHEAGDASRAFDVGRTLHGIMLMAAVVTGLRGIAPELFEYLIRYVFPLASDTFIAFDLDREILNAQADWLRSTIVHMEDNGWTGYVPGGPTRELRRLLSVDYGFDLRFGLGPRMKLTVPLEAASEDARRTVAFNNVAWEWGTSVLAAGRRQALMPEAAIIRMMAAHEEPCGAMAHAQPVEGA